LDVAVSAPNATTLRLGGFSSLGTQTVLLNFLEQATVVAHNTTTMAHMFRDCRELQSVPLFNTASVTSMANMFQSCPSLQTVPLFNTAAVTSMSTMFASCPSLREIPELTLSAISSASNNNMSLTSSVNLGKAKLTGMRWTQSFSGCNMAAAQLDEMYTALDKLNPNVTNVTATGTVVTYTVDDITAFVAARTVTITGVDPVAYNLTSVTVASVNVANSRFTVTNAATGTYVSGGVAALQDNRLITVTGNPGTTGDDPTIAENKGWTVTA
jgi:surface protein